MKLFFLTKKNGIPVYKKDEYYSTKIWEIEDVYADGRFSLKGLGGRYKRETEDTVFLEVIEIK